MSKKGGINTKRSWWETNNIQDILLISSHLVAGCLIWLKTDFWISISALYIVFGALVYHYAVENKNDTIDYLKQKNDQLENYIEKLIEGQQNSHNK